MATDPDTDDGRRAVGRCTECEAVFPIKIQPDGDVNVLGMTGECTCGNDTVVPAADE